MFWFNPLYFLFVGPALLLALVATILTQVRFKKYSRISVHWA